MKIAEIPLAVLRFQYQIARIPFQLIEDQMAARLYEEAPVRLFYERSLGPSTRLSATCWATRG